MGFRALLVIGIWSLGFIKLFMQIHQLKPIHKKRKRKRVGRGGKKGTYSGRGMKGQRARAGRKMQPSIRELIKKFPKLKGYRSKRFAKDIAIIDIKKLSDNFEDSSIVNPKILLDKGLIRRVEGKTPVVKILGNKEISKKLIIEGCKISKTAKAMIEKAGGTVK